MVYFLQSVIGGPIKIGFSSWPESRRDQIQAGSPFELRVIASMPGGRALEKSLHRIFRDHKLEREWFLPSLALAEMIESLGGSVFEPRVWEPTPWPGSINGRIRHLRAIGGVRREELFDLADYKPAFKLPLDRISKLFGATMEWLLHGSGPEPATEDVLAAVGKARREAVQGERVPARRARRR